MTKAHYCCHLFIFDVVKTRAGVVITPVCADCGRRRSAVVRLNP